MKWLWILLILFSSSAFSQDITGKWVGETTQKPGRTFYFEMDIQEQKGDQVSGVTTIKDTANGNYGKITFTGTFNGTTLNFQEKEILKEDKSKKDGYWNSITFSWCIKSGELSFTQDQSKRYLNGPWRSTGGCNPGGISISTSKSGKNDNGCEELESADFLLGVWRGKFKQFSCNIDDTFPMVVFINEVDGKKFSGMFIWTDMIYAEDSRSTLEGEIKDGKIYFYENAIISGSGLVLNGIYESVLENCEIMNGFWFRDHNDRNVCPEMKAFEKGGEYTLKHYQVPTIYFDKNSHALRKKSLYDLDQFAQFMKDFPSLKFQISGHTDRTGSNARNLVLSQERAKKVISYLNGKGIKSNRFEMSFHAHERPSAPNDTEENLQLNRRVEIQIKRN